MKRLSVPILLLVVACPAQAGYYLLVNGEPAGPEIYLQPSDLLNLGIVSDSASGLNSLVLTVEGPAAIEAQGCHCDMFPGGCPGATWCYRDLCDDMLYGSDWLCDEWGIDDGLWIEFIGLSPLAGLVVTDLIYHAEASGDVILSLLNADDLTLFDTVTIHQAADPPPAKLPDLFTHTVSDRFTPTRLSPSEMLSIRWLVENNSTVCIPEDPWCFEQFGPAHGPWVEAVFLSKDSHPDNGDILLGTVTFAGILSPGGSHEVRTPLRC